MIHSGSRNLGWQVADHYMKVAKILNAPPGQPHIVPPSFDLATLPVGSDEGQAYLREMNWALEFALLNRKVMMDIVKDAVLLAFPNAKFDREINIHHNFSVEEEHGGEKLWVHRKGATRAFAGMEGVIPGAQGSHSYIVIGKGNEDSYQSCSHGAGRKMSRTKAVDTLDLAAEIAEMEALGVVHALRTDADKAESKNAYKDVIQVMAYQTDLVDIDTELFTLGVLKGEEKDDRRKKKKLSAAEKDMDVDLG